MHYVCVEEGRVVNIVNYAPEVPKSMTVYPISDEEYSAIIFDTHYFDVGLGKVEQIPKHVAEHRQKFLAKKNGRAYLEETDWMVLRHIREKALDLPTTLTQEAYIALETERHEVAKGVGVVKPNTSLPAVQVPEEK